MLLEVTKPLPEKGYFVNPVLLGDLPHDARPVQKEIFGPVAVILPFKDTEEAASGWPTTPPTGWPPTSGATTRVRGRAASPRRSAPGTVWINGGGAMRPDAPFGGYGRSGVGRELGEWGMREYLEPSSTSSGGCDHRSDHSRGSHDQRTTGSPAAGGRHASSSSARCTRRRPAGRMLRDFGARGHQGRGPDGRRLRPAVDAEKKAMSIGFARLNSGKRSVGIDLRRDGGPRPGPPARGARRRRRRVLPARAGWRPGGWATTCSSADNPGLVLTRVSGFGQTGPYRERPGFGTVAETGSGFAFINGWPDTPPTSPPFGFADSIAGISAAMGTAMALFRRERTGQGDVRRRRALRAADVHPRRHDHELHRRPGSSRAASATASGSASPRGIYQASDGKWLSIAASNQGDRASGCSRRWASRS